MVSEKQRQETLGFIKALEDSIRAQCTFPVTAKRFEGPLPAPGVMQPKIMIEHALWYLERARDIAQGSDLTGTGWCIGTAAGLVLPYGIAARYYMTPIWVYPAMIAPCKA